MSSAVLAIPEGGLAHPGIPSDFAEHDLAALRRAVGVLETSTMVGRLSAMAGRPLEFIGRAMPAPALEVVSRATELALKAALKVALGTLSNRRMIGGAWVHRAAAAASGAFGGALGLATLPVELPISTVVMLRAIADVAREEGEDLADPETALECLQVFALGSKSEADDIAQSGYFAVRGMLAKSVAQVAKLAAGQKLTDAATPALVRLMAQIASRFGLVVSQKIAAGAVPVVGALGGAAVNAAFVEHFRTVALAHFTVRRLERRYGADTVRSAYDCAREMLAEPRVEAI